MPTCLQNRKRKRARRAEKNDSPVVRTTSAQRSLQRARKNAQRKLLKLADREKKIHKKNEDAERYISHVLVMCVMPSLLSLCVFT